MPPCVALVLTIKPALPEQEFVLGRNLDCVPGLVVIEHMGGQVAAPVFSRVVGGALRLLAVAPDQPINAPEVLPAGPALGNVRTAALP